MPKKRNAPQHPSPAAAERAPRRAFLERFTWKYQLAVLFLIAVGVYANSIFGSYALDDNIVVTANRFTQKGLAGIPEILLNDSFKGAFGGNQLAGGRYRPLSIVTFAIEWQFFGMAPMVSHAVNVLLFGAVVALLFLFLRAFIFREASLPPFLAALIFAVHPIHTEAVANIKSRDELMSLMFVLIALYTAARSFIDGGSGLYVVASVASFLLALLAKENAITFIAVLPLVLFFFSDRSWKGMTAAMAPYVATTGAYVLLRYVVAGFPSALKTTDVYLDPFVMATASQAVATKIFVLLQYLKLLVFPHPLCWDHTFNEVPYVNVTDLKFLISLVVHLALLGYAFFMARRKSVVAFAILLYFVLLSVVSNFVMETGTPMAERFLFQPSVAFAIACAYLVGKALSATSAQARYPIVVGLAALGVAGAYRTIDRNADWKNDRALFVADVDSCPGSSRVNMNGGLMIARSGDETQDPQLRKQIYERAIGYLENARRINPKALEAHINLALAYSRIGDVEGAAKAMDGAREIAPESALVKGNSRVLSQMLATRASELYSNGQKVAEATSYYERALRYDPENVKAMYELGGMYLMAGDMGRARQTWRKTLELQPDHPDAKQWLEKTGGRD